MRSNIKVYLLTTILLLLVSSQLYIPISAQRRNVNVEVVHQEEEKAVTRLSLRLYNDTPNMIYLIGENVDIEPNGGTYEPSHIMKYAKVVSANETEVETIVDSPVFPYKYDLEIDTTGNVHTTFVYGNYTLAYAVRDAATGQWDISNITNSDEIFAIAPDIELNSNDLPRIVYKGVYKENAANLFNDASNVNSLRTVIYTEMAENGEWESYDITDNKERKVTTSQFDTYNPGIKIIDDRVYVAYSNKITQSSITRLYYLSFPQTPTDLDSQEQAFFDVTHKYAMVGTVVSTIYTTPQMLEYNEGIVIVTGAFQFGGVTVSYLSDRNAVPAQDVVDQRGQWFQKEPDQSIHSEEVKMVDAILRSDGLLTITYSYYNQFDSAGQRYEFNVNLMSMFVSQNSLEDIKKFFVTDTTNIDHLYPNIELNSEEELKVVYFEQSNSTSLWNLMYGDISLPVVFPENSITPFFIIIFLFSGLLFGWYFLVQKLPEPEKDEEVLPHEINLREAMTEN